MTGAPSHTSYSALWRPMEEHLGMLSGNEDPAAWPAHQRDLLGEGATLSGGEQLLLLSAGAVPSTTPLPPGGQSAWLHAGDWREYLAALESFSGAARPLAAAWPRAQVLAGDAAGLQVAGIGGCRFGEETVDASGITFVRICGGRFAMGSPEAEKGRDSDEGPQHEVTVGEFWLGKSEVSNAQYRRWRKDHQGDDDDLPATSVSWNDAQAYCAAQGHRLPSEAEWEYAARAGKSTRYAFGDDEKELGDYAWYDGNSGNRAHAVATRQPNAWGLHDMHGNVWEWLQDCYHDTYNGAPADGSAWEGGECAFRVLRGGAFDFRAELLRSASRYGFWPGYANQDVGFRCARGPRRQP